MWMRGVRARGQVQSYDAGHRSGSSWVCCGSASRLIRAAWALPNSPAGSLPRTLHKQRRVRNPGVSVSEFAGVDSFNGFSELLQQSRTGGFSGRFARTNRNLVGRPNPWSYGVELRNLRWGQLDDVLGVAVPDGLRGSGELLVVDDCLGGQLEHGVTR